MRRAEPSRSLKPRGKGVYKRACNVCRRRKIRCDGENPCAPCQTSSCECAWGSLPAKKGATQQHVESLNKHIIALETYVSTLEAQLERCRALHGGLDGADQQARPIYAENFFSAHYDGQDEESYPWDSTSNAEQEDDIEILTAPTKQLKLECEDLYLYGPTSIFRLASRIPRSSPRLPQIVSNSNKRYELLLDGVEPVSFDPNFNWSRHLPVEVPLTRGEHDRCLDLLFKFSTSWCLRVMPPLFLRDMYLALSGPATQKPVRTPHYSAMLHNALLALATALSDDPTIRDFRSRQYFAQKAKGYMDAECAKPSISVVNALSLLASYHSSIGDQTLGYVYCGISVRLAQALGLYIDCSPWVKRGLISHEDMLDRNMCYWTTFNGEVCWSLYVGRDVHLPLPEGHNIKVPYVDSEFDQLPWHYPPSGLEPQPGLLWKTFAETCALFRLAWRIMDAVNRLGASRVKSDANDLLISKLNVELNAWQNSLPPELADTPSGRAIMLPHRIMLHLTYWWLFVLLHRPLYYRTAHIPPSARNVDHVKLCNRAAENTMSLLDTWRSLYGFRCVPIAIVQVIFSAATIYILAAAQAVSGARLAAESLSYSLSQLDLCLQHLSDIGKHWACAHRCAGILNHIVREQLTPRLERRSSKVPTHPLPQPTAPADDEPRLPAEPSLTQQSHLPPGSPSPTDSMADFHWEDHFGGNLPDWSLTFQAPVAAETGVAPRGFGVSGYPEPIPGTVMFADEFAIQTMPARFDPVRMQPNDDDEDDQKQQQPEPHFMPIYSNAGEVAHRAEVIEIEGGVIDSANLEYRGMEQAAVADPDYQLTDEELECMELFWKRQAQWRWV